jgi:hypothetical protein
VRCDHQLGGDADDRGVLLFIPIALSSPRLSPVWFVPVLAGLIPTPVGFQQLLFCVALEALVVAHVLSPRTSRRRTLGVRVPLIRRRIVM